MHGVGNQICAPSDLGSVPACMPPSLSLGALGYQWNKPWMYSAASWRPLFFANFFSPASVHPSPFCRATFHTFWLPCVSEPFEMKVEQVIVFSLVDPQLPSDQRLENTDHGKGDSLG